MKYTMNPVVLTGIQTLVSQIRDDLAEVEARREQLLLELSHAEATLESVSNRFITEPHEPSISTVNGHQASDENHTLVPDDAVALNEVQQNGINDPAPPVDGDEPQRRRYMHMAREVDYTEAENYSEFMRCIAEATVDGVVNATHMAEILISDGKSKSTMTNLPGTNRTHMRKSDDYEKVAEGTYQYLPMASTRGGRDE